MDSEGAGKDDEEGEGDDGNANEDEDEDQVELEVAVAGTDWRESTEAEEDEDEDEDHVDSDKWFEGTDWRESTEVAVGALFFLGILNRLGLAAVAFKPAPPPCAPGDVSDTRGFIGDDPSFDEDSGEDGAERLFVSEWAKSLLEHDCVNEGAPRGCSVC